MNPLWMKITLSATLLTGFASAQQAADPSATTSIPDAKISEQDSPAQQRIAAAKKQIQANPKKVQAFNELALGYLRRNRETANPEFLLAANQALEKGFNLDKNDFQLQKTRILLLLKQEDYVQAENQATQLNRNTPDDVVIYGYLTEANIALGNYPEAEKSAQWMLNMLPNNVPGLLLGAKLRVLYGDADGALDFLNLAYSETPPTETEEQAWIANQIASAQLSSGKFTAAARTLKFADRLFPHYPYTLENLAQVRIAQHRANDAVTLLGQAQQIDRDPGTTFELGEAQSAAGHPADAAASFANFERTATAPGPHSDRTRLDLILLYARDTAHAPQALDLARKEIATRHDVWTLDALAWALNGNGKFAEANASEQRALKVGIQSAQLFDHAGHIASNLKNPPEATRYFALAQSLSGPLNPTTDLPPAERSSIGSTKNPSPAEIQSPSSYGASGTRVPAFQAATRALDTAPALSPVPPALLDALPTDTDRLIKNAQNRVRANPKDAAALANLGAAYFQRARETGDVSAYQFAQEALTKSLDLVSSDFSSDAALGTMAEVCMGEHRFTDALTYSEKALALGSGDVSPFATVGDAYADMGEYRKAAAAYARLTPPEMTLSPRAAYARDSRLAYLKFIHGDTPGAITLMATSVAEGVEVHLPKENLAWLYFELAEFNTQAGNAAAADTAYLNALAVHPGDYRALAGLGKLRANQGRYAEAITLYEKAVAIVPYPIFVAELGDLYSKTGGQAEAQRQFRLVEYIGLLGHINQVLHNRDLALFYADHDIKLSEALRLARKEFEVRHDVYTWDALAWALYKNHKYEEAAKASEHALQFGTKDSLLLYHAGMIAEKIGKRAEAHTELAEALKINPHFHLIYAAEAKQRLAAWTTQTASNLGSNHVP